MVNVFSKLLLSINLTKITMQTTKLRPLICVTGWLLPPRHEFPHCLSHIIYPRPILTSHIADPRRILVDTSQAHGADRGAALGERPGR